MPEGWCTCLTVDRAAPEPPRYGQGKRRGITKPPLRKRKKRAKR